MRRILILSYFFPPMGGGGVQRMLNFARYLPQLGWEPHILTVKESSHYFNDPSLLKYLNKSVKIYRTGSLDFFRIHYLFKGRLNKNELIKPMIGDSMGLSHFIFIPDNRVGWYPYALHKAKKMCKKIKFDAILSSSPPNTSHLVAYKLSKETGIPWVADFRDPWVNNPNLALYTSFHRRIHNVLEKKVLQNTNVIVVVSKAFRDNFLKRHTDIRPEKISFIPNGYNEELFPEKKKLPEKFIITHTGIFSGNRIPDSFLQACSYLKTKNDRNNELLKNIKINFIGPISPYILSLIKKYDLEDMVHCKEGLTHNESVDYLLKSAINLLIVNIKSGHNAIIPSKLFDYLATRNPILALCEEGSEAAKIIRETESGKVVKPDDYKTMAKILEEYFNMYKKGEMPVTQLSKITKYTRRNLTKELVDILERVCS